MNDEDAVPGEGDGRAAKAALYMETLQARMDPDQYQALAHAVNEVIQFLVQGREGTIGSEGDAPFTPELNREFATVVNILLTGKMDQQIVDVPSSDGRSTGLIFMDPEEAEDPAKVQEVRDFLDKWSAEREAVNLELDGIERASNPNTDD
ncbi:hypothetical protein ABT275_42625 [Streptomyces sp. NPDC001185]|uniref:hypothetical protein n=1 Tax=Streptomyces sp. NPDC001185 TaxID=3154380 RepID=UPI003330B9B8